jgi:Tol biopolymer transport system component
MATQARWQAPGRWAGSMAAARARVHRRAPCCRAGSGAAARRTGTGLVLAAAVRPATVLVAAAMAAGALGPAIWRSAPGGAAARVALAYSGERGPQAVGAAEGGPRAVAADEPGLRIFLPSLARNQPDPRTRLTKNARRDWQPSFSPDGETIVYVSDDLMTGEGALRLVPLDGSGSRPVAIEGLMDYGRPGFTPDGEALVFAARATGVVTNSEIYRARTDGNVIVDLTQSPDIDERRPSLAPDGTWLVYDAVVDGNQDLYRLDLASGRRTRLTDDSAPDLLGSVSYDGRSIVFRSERDGNAELYRIGADGTGLARLTDHPATESYGSLAPDGQWLAFQSDRSDRNGVLAMDPGGENLRWLTDRRQTCLMPAISPDGERVAVACDDDSGNRDIYVVTADGAASSGLPAPVELGRIDGCRGAVASGRTVFALCGDAVQAWDVGHPAQPRVMSQLPLAQTLRLDGSTLYSGAAVIDAKDPTALTQVGWLPLEALDLAVLDVAAASGTAIATLRWTWCGEIEPGQYDCNDARGYMLADMSDPTQPRRLYSAYGTHYEWHGPVAANGQALFIVVEDYEQRTGTEWWLKTLARNGDGLGAFPIPETHSLFVTSRLAYVATYGAGIRILDISDPALPSEIGVIELPEDGLAIAVADLTAYVATQASGLLAFDVTDPRRPTRLGALAAAGSITDVAVGGGLAYVSDEGAGLRIVSAAGR